MNTKCAIVVLDRCNLHHVSDKQLKNITLCCFLYHNPNGKTTHFDFILQFTQFPIGICWEKTEKKARVFLHNVMKIRFAGKLLFYSGGAKFNWDKCSQQQRRKELFQSKVLIKCCQTFFSRFVFSF